MQPTLINRAAGRVRRYGRKVQTALDDYLVTVCNHPQPGQLQYAERRAAEFARQALLLGMAEGPGYAQLWTGLEKESQQQLRVAYLGDQYAKKVHSPQYLQYLLFEPAVSAGLADPERIRPVVSAGPAGPEQLRPTVSAGSAGPEQFRPAALAGSAEPDPFCPDHLDICERGAFPRTRPRAAAERLAGEADLVIFEGNALLGWTPPTGAWIWTPPWVRMVRTFTPGQPWEAVEQGMRGQKNNIKQMLKKGFTYRISHSDADFEHFYERMHVPMMQSRHAGYGFVDSKEGLRIQFERGHLMLIQAPDGQPVAGALFFVQNNAVFGMANGVLDGAQYWYDQGVMSAIYYYLLRWCHENQIIRFDAGGVRPFLTDGLHQFKSRWGFQPAPDLWSERRWLIWAPDPSPAALDWLRNHPVAEVEGSRISA